MARTNRTPIDGTTTDQLQADLARLKAEDTRRRGDRLTDPSDSNHFAYDPAVAPDPDPAVGPYPANYHTHADGTRITLRHVHPFDGPHEHAPDPDDETDEIVVVSADMLTAAASPRDGEKADPNPPAPDTPTSTSEPGSSSPAGSGGGSGRPPLTGRSIGRVLANTVTDTALGVPHELRDERAHAREMTEILLEAAADHHRHNRPMPAHLLLDLEGIVLHMVANRGLRGDGA